MGLLLALLLPLLLLGTAVMRMHLLGGGAGLALPRRGLTPGRQPTERLTARWVHSAGRFMNVWAHLLRVHYTWQYHLRRLR
jgi:hypothetical protein